MYGSRSLKSVTSLPYFILFFYYRTGTSLSGGKIAGIVIAVILITTILTLVIICFMVPLLRV